MDSMSVTNLSFSRRLALSNSSMRRRRGLFVIVQHSLALRRVLQHVFHGHARRLQSHLESDCFAAGDKPRKRSLVSLFAIFNMSHAAVVVAALNAHLR
jgi:hypothetical protein